MGLQSSTGLIAHKLRLCIGVINVAFCEVAGPNVLESVVQQGIACDADGGVLIGVARVVKPWQNNMELVALKAGRWPMHINEDGSFGGVPVCVPRKCYDLTHTDCEKIKGWIIGRLSKDNNQHDLILDKIANDHPWLLSGVSDEVGLGDQDMYKAMHAQQSSYSLRSIIIGWHGPLAALVGEHLQLAAQTAMNLELDLSIYASCYLCNEVARCRTKHIPSLADTMCEHFHDSSATFDELHAAAKDVTRKQPHPHVVVCLGLALCYFYFMELAPTIPRLQLLCMNPVQGVPKDLVGMILLDIVKRAKNQEFIHSTNAVTSSLLSYHAGLDGRYLAPPMTLFPLYLSNTTQSSLWQDSSKKVLLVQSFLLHNLPICWTLRAMILQSLPQYSVEDHPQSWNFEEVQQVVKSLEYQAGIFIPESPYKNLFNELYTMNLPLFVPNVGFLSKLWPVFRHTEIDQAYDGWFDRRIPRVRLTQRSGLQPPEPFDLDVDGEAKVLYWARLSDFYHFPGVYTFSGVAGLVEQLTSATLSIARKAMQQHVQDKYRVSAARFQELIYQTQIPKLSAQPNPK